MAIIRPFKGVLYNQKKVSIQKVVAPPYDVISDDLQDRLYKKDRFNIIRLILGKTYPDDNETKNRYIRARETYQDWLKQGILLKDKAPSIYIYIQQYEYEGKRRTRYGFISRMRIEDPKASRVLPHEYTSSKPKMDRLNLIRVVKANLSPIFSIFEDPDHRVLNLIREIVCNSDPIINIAVDGIRHKVWGVTARTKIMRFQDLMLDRQIFIADGHHRYEVALTYRNERLKNDSSKDKDKKPYNYVMMFFCPVSDDGLTILATHRILKRIHMDTNNILKSLGRYFYITKGLTKEKMLKMISSPSNREYIFGMQIKRMGFYLLRLKDEKVLDKHIEMDKSEVWRRLNVSILHKFILRDIMSLKDPEDKDKNIIYTRDAEFAVSEVETGDCQIAFFLPPTKVSEVIDVATSGDRMPYKSTFFYPKLLSGLVISDIQ